MENEEAIKQVELLGQSITDAITTGYALLAPRVAELESHVPSQLNICAQATAVSLGVVKQFTELEQRVGALESAVLEQERTMCLILRCVHVHQHIFINMGIAAAKEIAGVLPSLVN